VQSLLGQAQCGGAAAPGFDAHVQHGARVASAREVVEIQPLEHVLDAARRDDSTRLQQQHARREPRDLVDVVRDVEHGHTEDLRQTLEQRHDLALAPMSSAESGSSINSSRGLVSSARPIATRCCSPAESDAGLRGSSGARSSSRMTVESSIGDLGAARRAPCRTAKSRLPLTVR
jgi:hypothetical protein